MGRLISLLVGYAFGNFLTAEVVSRKASGNSVFNYRDWESGDDE